MSYLNNMSPGEFEDFCLRLLKAQGFTEVSSDVSFPRGIGIDFVAQEAHDGALVIIQTLQIKIMGSILNNALFKAVSLQKLKNSARVILIISIKAPQHFENLSKELGVEIWDATFIQDVVERHPDFFEPAKPENLRPGTISLKSIDLENFRGVKKLHLDFSKVTVFVGKNGAGKSTVLDAIAIGLSWFSRHMVNLQSKGFSISESDIGIGTNETNVELNALIEEKEVTWSISKVKPGTGLAKYKSSFKELDKKIKNMLGNYITPENPLPLVAYYSVHRTVQNIAVESNTDASSERISELYQDAIGGDRQNFQGFFEWFRKKEDLEHQRQKEQNNPNYVDKQLEIVRKAVLEILGEDIFSDLRIDRATEPAKMIATKGSDILDINQLSDGEKCLLGMVGDLARRFALANPSETNSPLDGSGVVLIDEIELHLHPQLQREIIGYLTKTFPNCQFIITTHSAPVVSHSHYPVILVKNTPDGVKVVSQKTYGRDTSQLLNETFGARTRPDEVQAKFDQIAVHLDRDEAKEASKILSELKSIVGEDDLEVVHLNAMISFLDA